MHYTTKVVRWPTIVTKKGSTQKTR